MMASQSDGARKGKDAGAVMIMWWQMPKEDDSSS